MSLYLDPKAPPVLDGAISFETGASTEDVRNLSVWAYEHHGSDFDSSSQGALTRFYEDMVSGRLLPPSFVTHRINGPDTIVAASLFLNRELVLLPETAKFVASVDWVHRKGLPALAVQDPDMCRFFRLLASVGQSNLSGSELEARLTAAIGWVTDYLDRGQMPALGQMFLEPRVLDRGPHGFVVAETRGDLLEGWVELFRQGYDRGVLFGPHHETRLPVLIGRRSGYVGLDLPLAGARLNELEVVHGGFPQWRVQGDFLVSPSDGTLCTAVQVVRMIVGS